jgi:hypothetical protein
MISKTILQILARSMVSKIKQDDHVRLSKIKQD